MSRLSTLPYNEKVFSESILSYEEALDISKYKKEITYKRTSNKHKPENIEKEV